MEITLKGVKDYIHCPYKYYIIHQTKQKVPPTTMQEEFNIAIRRATLAFFEHVARGESLSEEDLRGYFGKIWYTFTKSSEVMFRDEGINDKRRKLEMKGVSCLSTFYRQQKYSKDVPILIDAAYKVPVGEHFLIGTIELVKQVDDPKKGKCIELTHISPSSYDANMFSLLHDMDLNEQVFAYRKQFGIREHESTIYHLEDGKTVYSKRPPDELVRFESMVANVLKGIETKTYYPRYSPYCNGCQAREACDRITIE